MKPSPALKETIKAYLDDRAKVDELFAKSYSKEKKNLDDCCTYILNTVHKSGCNGFTDDEVFSMAVHYYDEDKIDHPVTIRQRRRAANGNYRVFFKVPRGSPM